MSWSDAFALFWGAICLWALYGWLTVRRGDIRAISAFRAYGVGLVRIMIWPTLIHDVLGRDWLGVAVCLYAITVYFKGGGGGGWKRKLREWQDRYAPPDTVKGEA